MQPKKFVLSLAACTILTLAARAQNQSGTDSTGLPGDNFSLRGALEMFQKANSPEDFEKLINAENNHVNNLDLNEDGDIDYVRVIDMSDNDAHAFVLQVPVSESENQDIAVIELEKTGNESAMIQIIGDEDIYGEEVIVEPDSGDGDAANIYDSHGDIAHGPSADYQQLNTRVIVNVWFWPGVRYVYAPGYVMWRSPWKWRSYPGWWRPWKPLGWHAYRPYRMRSHTSFVVVRTHRVVRAHRIYTPMRVTSVTVRKRHYTAVNGYRVSRSRTTVTGPGGNRVSRKTTTVRGNGGQGRRVKTTTRKRR